MPISIKTSCGPCGVVTQPLTFKRLMKPVCTVWMTTWSWPQAAEEGRLLVSHDYRTMPTHFAIFVTTRTSAGVLLVSQALPLAEVVEDLLLIWEASEAEEWINRFDTLPL
jgi:hypothetical protein